MWHDLHIVDLFFPMLELTAGICNRCKCLVLYWWVSELYTSISMTTSGVTPLIKLNINCATWYLWRTLNVNNSCSLKRSSVLTSLETLQLWLRIIVLCSIIKGDIWFTCNTTHNITVHVSKIWIRQSVIQWFFIIFLHTIHFYFNMIEIHFGIYRAL